MSAYTSASIGEINAAIEGGELTFAQAKKILTTRSQRKNSASGVRAAAWLKAHDVRVPTARKAPAVKATPAPAKEFTPAQRKRMNAKAEAAADALTDGNRGKNSGWRTAFFAELRTLKATARANAARRAA